MSLLQQTYFANTHNLNSFKYEINNLTGLPSSIIDNMYKELKSWNDINGMTECQFSEQALLSLLLLFSEKREFEISKYFR
ncbi:hypothetical protein HPULCUR_000835 [Helicostylum pulchrum]|uniref:Uncharacterized protein n=1 Tax=Helicostylum pulchrum TaxID=562976 RepID=A0ABP9XKZ7_9FUNG